MSVEPIGAVALILGLLMVLSRGPELSLYVLALSTLFGAAAIMKMPALGDANILPAHFLVLFFLAWTALRPERTVAAVRSLNFPSPGFWLAAVVVFGLISALLLPRIFAGQTLVFSLARGEDYVGIVANPLKARASNLTQVGYLFVDLACFACVAGAARVSGTVTIAKALVLAGAACVVFAVLDVVTYATKTAELLSFMRNANYRMLAEGQILGLKRIVGSFPEASAFGFGAVGLFAFSLRLWLQDVWPRATGLIAVALLAAIALCTSTTAYVALGLYALALWARCLIQTATGGVGVRVASFALALPFVALVAVFGVMLNQSASEAVMSLFDATVSSKLETQSGLERMSWNEAALQSFFDTAWLGAGVGSVRASSFVVAALANIGAFGLALYAIFLATLLKPLRTVRSIEDKIRVAAGSACWVQLVAACISAGGVDLGLMFFIFAPVAAIAPAAASAREVKRAPRSIALPNPIFGRRAAA